MMNKDSSNASAKTIRCRAIFGALGSSNSWTEKQQSGDGAISFREMKGPLGLTVDWMRNQILAENARNEVW